MEDKKLEPKKQKLTVKALDVGYFDGSRRKAGVSFVLESVKQLSKKWMEPEFDVDEAKAYEAKLAAEAKAEAEAEAKKAKKADGKKPKADTKKKDEEPTAEATKVAPPSEQDVI